MNFFNRQTMPNIFERQRPFERVPGAATTRQRAYNIIKEPRHQGTILHLWELPSFDDPRSWTVFFASKLEATQPDASSPPHLQATHWDSQYDYDRFKPASTNNWHIHPRLITREVVLDWARFATLLNEAKMLSFPVFGLPDQIGLPWVGVDGNSYGLLIQDVGLGICWASIRLIWWEDGSPAWQPMAEWYHRIVGFFTESLDNAESA